MRNESEIISREYEINKQIGKAVVVVSLLPSVGREKIITIRTSDVRTWLESQEDVKLGMAVQGGSFNNNMTRRLGNKKTIEDLKMTYVFEILEEEKIVTEPEPVLEEKPAPKRTSRSVKSTTSESAPVSTVVSTTSSSTEPTEVKKTTTRRRARKKTTTTKTESVKGDQ